MKIIIPELKNPTIQEAIQNFPDLEFVPADSLDQACELLNSKQADSILSGLDYSSRDVLLAYRDHISLKSQFFSSSFICEKGDQIYALADGGVNKLPNQNQLYTIVDLHRS